MAENDFDLPVVYNNEERLFPSRLYEWGYGYKIDVYIEDSIISFERDEERNWRAMINPETLNKNAKVTGALIQAIVVSLDELTG